MEIITQLTKKVNVKSLNSSVFCFTDCSQIPLVLAQGLLLAPASQTYIEQIFSLCSFLTITGQLNQLQQSLKMRAFSN